MATEKRYTLHYAGLTFDLPAEHKDFILELGDRHGAVEVPLMKNKSVTVVYGPGIPIAVVEEPKPTARVAGIR